MALEVELKEAIDGIGRSFEEFKAENDKLIKKGVRDALGELKLEQLGQRIDDLTGKKEDLEKRIKAERELREELERKVNLLSVTGGTKTDDQLIQLAQFNVHVKSFCQTYGRSVPSDIELDAYQAYKAGLNTYLRKGKDDLSEMQRKAMSIGSEPDGGYMVTPDTTGRMIERVYDLSAIRQIANVQAISSDRLEGTYDTDEAEVGWVGEVQARNDTNNPQVGRYEIPVHEMYAQPKISQRLLDDAGVDIEAWLQRKVGDRMGRFAGAAYVVGNGVAKPRGFTTYPTAATPDATRPWGTLEHVVTGVNGDFAATNAADVLYDIEGAFKPEYLNNARWVTRRSVITKVRKFKQNSDNQYLWQPGLQAGKPATLIGYPVFMAEDMPALGTGSLSLALGDFNWGYQIVDRLGMRTLRDPYTSKPFVRFYTIWRTGAAVIQFEAIKFVKFST